MVIFDSVTSAVSQTVVKELKDENDTLLPK